MANVENLKPFTSDQDREKAKANGRIGGIKSGEVRREKRKMRDMLEMCLEMKHKSGKTYQELATLGLINGAIKGNAKNFRLMLELLGELKQDDEQKKNDGVLGELVEALKDAKKD